MPPLESLWSSYAVFLIEYMGAEIIRFNGVLEWLEKFLK